MPASSRASSRSRPAGPTNGLPPRSSRSPGTSPTITTSAVRAPSPNTVWVALAQRRQGPALRQEVGGAHSRVLPVGRRGRSGGVQEVVDVSNPLDPADLALDPHHLVGRVDLPPKHHHPVLRV